MSEIKRRKVNSPAFKAKLGLEAVRGVSTINEIGREYGVHPVQVGQWKKAIQERAGRLFEGKRGPKPALAHEEPERLYGEIGKLKMELDWLKKSPGSTCHDASILDWFGVNASRGAPVRVSERVAGVSVRPPTSRGRRRLSYCQIWCM